MKKKTVFVIEQGSYSGYHVVGVFSTQENAELVMAKVEECWEAPSIAEWELDPAVEELSKGYTVWLGEMLRDGTVERCVPQKFSSYTLKGSVFIWRRSTAPVFKGKNVQDCLHGTVLAKNRVHAIKIFNEKRAQLIAQGKWEEAPL